MQFSDILYSYNVVDVKHAIYSATDSDVQKALSKNKLDINDLMALLSPVAKKYLHIMGEKSRKITLQRFGKTMKLYAPLYVSNYCVNSCVYCGFNRHTNIDRLNLSSDDVEKEAKILASQGIANVILVSGDNHKQYSNDMLADAIKTCAKYFPLVSIEVRALGVDEYVDLKKAGADGYTMFQETYLADEYKKFHPAGPKSDFEYRLNCPDRIGQAGYRHIGLGALLGLTDFRLETFFMCLHADYLSKKYYESHVSASFPRMRLSAGEFKDINEVTDGELFQAIFAFRLFLNDCGINISTRESADMRNKLMHLGATIMSAGSKTEPGGYSKPNEKSEQFNIDDSRTIDEFSKHVKLAGYDPIFKDWDKQMRYI